MDQKTHLFFLHVDLVRGCWTICNLSHLGANRGKRVRHLESMKFRDFTKGKYQSNGNQQKKKKYISTGEATQLPKLAMRRNSQLLLPLMEPFEYFSGNLWPSPASLNSKDGGGGGL